jgi:hypothetical protein
MASYDRDKQTVLARMKNCFEREAGFLPCLTGITIENQSRYPLEYCNCSNDQGHFLTPVDDSFNGPSIDDFIF